MIRAVNFFVECIKTFNSTGCLFPSSPWVADQMTYRLENSTPKKIIEIGAGTGPVTVKVLDKLDKDDFFVICEMNPKFFAVLEKKVKSHKNYGSNVELICAPIQEYNTSVKFDHIICSLPFLNFDIGLTNSIFNTIKGLCHNETIMVYYEYMGVRNFKKNVLHSERVKELDIYFSLEFIPRIVERIKVWWNILPVEIRFLKVLD